ncbi:unnamed protein product, partial [Larinioides sclopetarius]
GNFKPQLDGILSLWIRVVLVAVSQLLLFSDMDAIAENDTAFP